MSRFFSVFVPAYLLIKLVSFQILIFIFGIPVFSLPFFSSVYPYFFSTVIRCFPHVCILPHLFLKVNNSNYFVFFTFPGVFLLVRTDTTFRRLSLSPAFNLSQSS